MIEDDDLIATVKRFIIRDARQRVSKMVTGLRADRKNVKWELTCPSHGTVDYLEDLPDVSPPYQTSDQWTPWYTVRDGKIYWLDIPLVGTPGRWSGYERLFSTYRRTKALDWYLWCEYSADPEGPFVPVGHTLEIIDNKRRDHEFLVQEGIHCDMHYYLDPKEVVGVDRQYTKAFIASFALPGEQPVSFTTLDTQINYLNGLTTQSGLGDKTSDRETSDHAAFLRKLKAQCYALRDEKGPSAMRNAFEIYKTVAKYLDGEHEENTKVSA